MYDFELLASENTIQQSYYTKEAMRLRCNYMRSLLLEKHLVRPKPYLYQANNTETQICDKISSNSLEQRLVSKHRMLPRSPRSQEKDYENTDSLIKNLSPIGSAKYRHFQRTFPTLKRILKKKQFFAKLTKQKRTKTNKRMIYLSMLNFKY